MDPKKIHVLKRDWTTSLEFVKHSRHIFWEMVYPLQDKTKKFCHHHYRSVCDCLGIIEQCQIIGAMYVQRVMDWMIGFVTSIHSMHVSCFVLSFIHGMQRRGHARLRNCWANFSSRINFFKLTKIDAKVRVPWDGRNYVPNNTKHIHLGGIGVCNYKIVSSSPIG